MTMVTFPQDQTVEKLGDSQPTRMGCHQASRYTLGDCLYAMPSRSGPSHNRIASHCLQPPLAAPFSPWTCHPVPSPPTHSRIDAFPASGDSSIQLSAMSFHLQVRGESDWMKSDAGGSRGRSHSPNCIPPQGQRFSAFPTQGTHAPVTGVLWHTTEHVLSFADLTQKQ